LRSSDAAGESEQVTDANAKMDDISV
jgi:hypothetical protein